MILRRVHKSFLLQLVLFLSLIQVASSAFIQTQSCNLDNSNFALRQFVIDAALDEKNKKLKFFINSMVIQQHFNGTDRRNTSDPAYVSLFNPVITDVNPATNVYTAFHVDIDFLGKTLISQNLRLCDMVAVKDTQAFENGPRFNPPTPASSNSSGSNNRPRPSYLNGGGPKNNKTGIHKQKRYLHVDYDDYDEYQDGDGTLLDVAQPVTPANLSSSNATIEYIFSTLKNELPHCPLYDGDSIMLYYEADISSYFHELGSYTVKFTVISNTDSEIIGCSKVYVTPVQRESIFTGSIIGIVALLVVTGFLNMLTVVYSSYQESSNPCLFQASTICNEDLLKQLDANVPRIMLYLQFALFIGGLDLQYPGFYQPSIGYFRWCALLGYNVFRNSHFRHSLKSDNIYRTFNLGGLRSLTMLSNDSMDHFGWTNFMVCFILWLIIQAGALQSLLWLKKIVDKVVKKYNKNNSKVTLLNDEESFDFSWKRNLYFIVGNLLESFLVLFALPFLVLTSALFYESNNAYKRTFNSMDMLQSDAFSLTTPYDQMFQPYYIVTPNDNRTMTPQFDASINYNHSSPDGPFVVYKSVQTTPVPIIIVSIILYCFWLFLVGYFIFNYLISFKKWGITTNKKISRLYTSIKVVMLWGFMYQHYHPARLLFICGSYISLIVKALIIGCVQSNGIVQVSVLIVLEFVEVASLFIIKPNYVSLRRISTVWILPVARFLVTVLCVPLIRELNLSELSRTYVAYAQFIIHLIVACVFVIQLIWCFSGTLISIYKMRKERLQFAMYSGDNRTLCSDDFAREFEYKPVQLPKSSPTHTSPTTDLNSEKDHYNQFTFYSYPPPSHVPDSNETIQSLEDINGDFYYRSQSQKILKKFAGDADSTAEKAEANVESNKKTSDNSHNSETAIVDQLSLRSQSDLQSFSELQHFSDLRKKKNDYRVREGDQIYKKYFVDSNIDPEIKALWDARSYKQTQRNTTTTTKGNITINANAAKGHIPINNGFSATAVPPEMSTTPPSKLHKLTSEFSTFIKPLVPKKQEKGFHVSRPRQLVIKTLAEVNLPDTSSSEEKDTSRSPDSFSKSLSSEEGN